MLALVLALVLRLALLVHHYTLPALAADGDTCIRYGDECLERHIEEVTPLWP